MAIVYQSGSVYATSVGQLVSGRTKVAHIIFCPHSGGDEMILHDGTSGSDPIKLDLHGSGAHQTIHLDLSSKPMVFATGIYLGTISANCHVTIITTNEGAGV